MEPKENRKLIRPPTNAATGKVIGKVPSSRTRQETNDEADAAIVLNLEELERIYKIYHGSSSHKYFESKTIVKEQDASIPHLKQGSLFFTCYDDNVYESVLDELKNEYKQYYKDKVMTRKYNI